MADPLRNIRLIGLAACRIDERVPPSVLPRMLPAMRRVPFMLQVLRCIVLRKVSGAQLMLQSMLQGQRRRVLLGLRTTPAGTLVTCTATLRSRHAGRHTWSRKSQHFTRSTRKGALVVSGNAACLWMTRAVSWVATRRAQRTVGCREQALEQEERSAPIRWRGSSATR
jgi:hypothetical protein